MESIFFEKQEAALCAQHALNMLLQGEYFSADTLAEIAHTLDTRENVMLDEGSKHAKSQNMDDTGFFSVQVIAKALESFDLELIPLVHPNAAEVKSDPVSAKAFICNMSEHWFTLRKIGFQWFSLNSTKNGPQLLSDMYLDLYLHKLTQDGYTIFVVNGVFPHCTADEVLAKTPVAPPPLKPTPPKGEKKEKSSIFSGIGHALGYGGSKTPDRTPTPNSEDDDLQAAIAMSLSEMKDQQGSSSSKQDNIEDELDIAEQERHVQLALLASVQEAKQQQERNQLDEAEKVRLQREKFLQQLEK